ncbi:MAG: RNA methyltransferase [Candidatus Brocadiae bacterium]|nr:RNA methyltransferase [Candidatus Brocadiia bacterium]
MKQNISLEQFPILSKARTKYFCELGQKKYRKERGEFLAEGIRVCYDLLNTSDYIHTLVFSPKLLSHSRGEELLAKALLKKIEIFQTSEETLEKMADTCQPQPVIACLSCCIPPIESAFFDDGRRFLVLCDISDPGNVGTLLRTAEAFGWDKILCTGSTAELYNPKVLRASMGSAFRLRIVYSELSQVLSFLAQAKIPSLITMPREGCIPSQEKMPQRFALFLGSEAYGLPDSVVKEAAQILRLPMSPKVESLNVAIAGGIALFLLRDENA